MTDLELAVLEISAALEACGLPYMLIGGLAVSAWGEPRSTLDVDISVWADSSHLRQAVICLTGRMTSSSTDPVRFVEQTRVLPLRSSRGTRIDVVFGELAIQHEAILRAQTKKISSREIPVASVEDMLLMKLISEREKDLADARALLRRFGGSIDRNYLEPKLRELAEALARPDILEMFNRLGWN